MNEETPIISKADMAKLLGRSLSTVEDANYELYLNITVARLQDLLCIKELPTELELDFQLLIARCFAVIGVEQNTSLENIESKKVEDFSVNYSANSKETPMTRFVNINSATIAKYSQCQGKIKSGELRCGYRFRYL